MISRLWLAILLLNLILISEAAHKCVWVTGVLKCRKNPRNHANVEVRVYDKDGISILQAIDPDDIMGVTFTDEDGTFKLDGCGDDFDWLPGVPNVPEPYLQIRHFCNSEKGETIRLPEFDVFVPDTYDVGILELDETATSTTNPKFGNHADEPLVKMEIPVELEDDDGTVITKPDKAMHKE
ncbi:unnamed protein product [Bursaphelenchus xylophilus]|uniref:(pine wood nematode) hypothetical protein n=1 Tax=Bursaphelenchus xylophilus TaxID=6326 RepID=A0A1I7RJ29_BURXY|nr:unnamed protein product [Bursaphelenchus xylophilus]CAG9119293.1 unnamed protein product [Bursaphelenchus xylophilus]